MIKRTSKTPLRPAPPRRAVADGPARVPSRAKNVDKLDRAASAAGTEIICPVLRALVNEGMPMAPSGEVNLDDLREAIEARGSSTPFGAAVWGIGALGNKPTDIAGNLVGGHFNVKQLPEGIVPHPADTGILRQGRFDEGRFLALVAHADGGVMTPHSFANAIAANYLRDVKPGNVVEATVKGLNLAEAEFGALLAVFGQKNPKSGVTGIAVEDLRALYERGEIPAGMQNQTSSILEAAALQASLKIKADVSLAGHALRSILTATGLSARGANLSSGAEPSESGAAQAASGGAGKAAACPYLNGSVPMPASPAAVANAHTAAGVDA